VGTRRTSNSLTGAGRKEGVLVNKGENIEKHHFSQRGLATHLLQARIDNEVKMMGGRIMRSRGMNRRVR
jgi:hypothetical protein